MSDEMNEMNGKAENGPGWVAFQAPDWIVALLERMAAQDAQAQQDKPNKSALMRRLIVDEARERGLPVTETAA